MVCCSMHHNLVECNSLLQLFTMPNLFLYFECKAQILEAITFNLGDCLGLFFKILKIKIIYTLGSLEVILDNPKKLFYPKNNSYSP